MVVMPTLLRALLRQPASSKQLWASLRSGLVYVRWRRRLHGTSGLELRWRGHTQCELESDFHRDLYCQCERYRHHDFDGEHRRHFVIGDGGNELKYVGTDPTGGIVVGGSMVKQ